MFGNRPSLGSPNAAIKGTPVTSFLLTLLVLVVPISFYFFKHPLEIAFTATENLINGLSTSVVFPVPLPRRPGYARLPWSGLIISAVVRKEKNG